MEINEHVGLTIDDCLEVLQNVYTDQKFEKDSISFEMRPLSATLQGYGAEHLILTISYKTTNNEAGTNQFFLKNLNGVNSFITTIISSLNGYEKEEFLYHIFSKECKAMGIDNSFAPLGYYARPHMLIMEDLSQTDFHTGDKHKLLDFGQCRAMLDALAKFHMSVVIYEHEKRKINTSYSLAIERPDIVLERVEKNGNVNIMERWIQASIDGLLATIDALPADDAKGGFDKGVFKQKLKTYLEEFYDDLTAKEGDLCCLLHNDLWCNNIMFLYPSTSSNDVDGASTGDPIDCKLIDYQVLSYGHPAMDVMRAIHTNTRQETRDRYKQQLLRYYFQATVDRLETFGISPDGLGNWTWDIFSSTCDRVELAMKIRCIAARSMTFCPDDVTEKYLQVTDGKGAERLLFTHRVASMLEAYTTETGDNYRAVIGEDINELWRLLQTREAKQSSKNDGL